MKEVELYDKFNRPTHTDIYPVTKMVCRHCGAVYYIKWVDSDTGNGKIPVCTDKSSISKFQYSIIQYARDKRRKL